LVAYAQSYDQSTINISGGVVHEPSIWDDDGTINITGGECWNVYANRGTLNISGGQITGDDGIYAGDFTRAVNIYGHGFEYDPYRSPNLTGFWQDGTPFGINFQEGSWDAVVLHETPEPATLLLLGLGCLALRRNRRAK